MQLTFDQEANALYVKLTDTPVARTHTERPGVLLDLTESGELVGIELLDPANASVVPSLLSKYGVPSGPLDYSALGRVLSGTA